MRTLLISLLTVLTLLAAPLQAGHKVSVYFFGNSLINHVTDSDQTTVPYWLNQLARAGGHSFATDGQFGFMRNFRRDLPPTATWSFDGVAGVWNPNRGGFAKAGFDAIVLSPTNFIQYQPADAPFWDADPADDSPLAATLAVLDWLQAEGVTAPFYIYEGWPDMGELAPEFPPSERVLRKYYKQALGSYHNWYLAYRETLAAARPDMDIRLIPVSKTLAELLSRKPLADIPVTRLYSDNAPHGTATLYLLAAMITYATLYGEAPPTNLELPDSISPVLVGNFAAVAAEIAKALNLKPEAAKLVSPEPPTLTAAPARGLTNPSLAMGLNGISDWSTQFPFLDLMKSARPWVGHLPGRWGGLETSALEADGVLDANGWPKIIPDTVTGLESLILTDQPEAAISLSGRYRLTYRGSGRIKLTGRAKNVSSTRGELWFDYTPGEGSVGILISETDPAGSGDYIRDIKILRENRIPLDEVGALFNPDWIARIEDFRVLRFMDWMGTNGSEVSRWQERALTSDYTYGRRGVPLEVMLALANEVGADPWFNMPHKADDDYVRQFAEAVESALSSDLRAYVEYSNEVWNFLFPQAKWAQEQAQARWGDAAEGDGWMQFTGMRAARIANIWTEVFGADADTRLVQVIAVHTGWPGLEKPLLNAPLWQAEAPGVNLPPQQSFDAYAVTGYFGYEPGGSPLSDRLPEWLREGRKLAASEATAQGLTGAAKTGFIADNAQEFAARKLTADLRANVLPELLTTTLPYHARVAKKAGLELIMYEGGTHIVGGGDLTDNEAITEFLTAYNYSEDMAALYRELLEGWQQAGGTLFTAFVDVAPPSKWGSWGALRNLDDTNPRADVLWNFNSTTPAWWGWSPPGSFTQGGLFQGGPGDDMLGGTLKADTLIGGAGNDTLLAAGNGDRLHGGAGKDVAVLRGRLEDYVFEWVGKRLRARGPRGTYWLIDIESVRFVP